VTCCAQPPEGSGAAAKGVAGEKKDVAVFAPERHMPPAPPEWLDKRKQQREEEVRNNCGIRIRRRPPSGPSNHSVGDFEFIIEDDENKPINILEEIVWNTDLEVARMKEKMPLNLVRQAIMQPGHPPARDFIGTLKERGTRRGMPGAHRGSEEGLPQSRRDPAGLRPCTTPAPPSPSAPCYLIARYLLFLTSLIPVTPLAHLPWALSLSLLLPVHAPLPHVTPPPPLTPLSWCDMTLYWLSCRSGLLEHTSRAGRRACRSLQTASTSRRVAERPVSCATRLAQILLSLCSSPTPLTHSHNVPSPSPDGNL